MSLQIEGLVELLLEAGRRDGEDVAQVGEGIQQGGVLLPGWGAASQTPAKSGMSSLAPARGLGVALANGTGARSCAIDGRRR
ncbi:MAG TPA: hypothetical protein VEL03_19815 [Streptosporangiaceae bacterium]|nr:hypothetical protein [Streptosporangiaceae bacterium]